MAEQLQQAQRGVDLGSERPEDAAASRLGRLLDELHAATPEDRPALVTRLGQALAALPRSDAGARLLLQALASGRLAELVDTEGRLAAGEAVRALLRLGYPWALELEPEDLAAFRAEERRRAPARPWVVLALVGLLAAGAASYLALGTRQAPPVAAPVAPAPPR
jgi:hypothetical protein